MRLRAADLAHNSCRTKARLPWRPVGPADGPEVGFELIAERDQRFPGAQDGVLSSQVY